LLFNHSVCETTLAIRADLLKGLYIGTDFFVGVPPRRDREIIVAGSHFHKKTAS
jgi:hypothetical protein